jgi:hypothetical protein
MEEKIINNIQTFFKNDVKIDGFWDEAVPNNEEGACRVKGTITSFSDSFFSYARNICKLIDCTPDNTNSLLIIINQEFQARIYKNNYPVFFNVIPKKSKQKGEPLYNYDIVHVSEVSFSCSKEHIDIDPKNGDQLIWIHRVGFVFGLYFDMTRKLDFETAKREMGHLLQKMLYFDVYKTLEPQSIVTLQKHGWFPFIQLLGDKYNILIEYFNKNKKSYIEALCRETLTDEWVEEIVSRWWINEVFKTKKTPIEEGLSCFYEKKYAAAISTLTPMIEGLINAFSVAKIGKGVKYDGDKIVAALIEQAKIDTNSLLFPELFADYLRKYFYKNTKGTESDIAVRHTVSHGRVTNEAYTREAAIKIILILDQILFYCA